MDVLIDRGELVGYVLTGVLAFVGLGLVQLWRRRADVKRARIAVRLATYSIAPPRVGPVAVKGRYTGTATERTLDCGGQRVELGPDVEVVAGTRGRWRSGVRTYEVRTGDDCIAIGVMSRLDSGWKLATSPGEAGVQLYAVEPRPAPKPLLPWRAPLILALCGGIGFGALYGAGMLLVDTPPCTGGSLLRFQLAAAMPLVRDEALAKYTLERARCPMAR